MQHQPPLEVRQVAGRIWLQLGALAYGEGATLQEAADDLVARVLALVMAFRSGGIGPLSSEGPHLDLAMLEFLYELGRSPRPVATSASGCSASDPARASTDGSPAPLLVRTR